MEHYYPKVASLAELFKKPITSTETDISDYTERTFKTVAAFFVILYYNFNKITEESNY